MTQKRQSQPGRAGDGALLKRLEAEFSKKSNAHQSVILCFGGSPWQNRDAKWFSKHPMRSFRMRAIHPGEMPDSLNDGQTHALVRQLQPGLRDKRFILYTAPEHHLDAELTLLALWQRLADVPAGEAIPMKHAIDDALRMGCVTEGLQ